MIELGGSYVDKITGFTGVALGYVQYLTGCNQVLLCPRGDEPSKRPESEWFDEQRLDRLSNVERVTLENGNNPGCDRSAPKQ